MDDDVKPACGSGGLTAFKYEGQRAILQEAVDEALSVLREVERTL